MSLDMSIASRAAEFCKLLEHTEVTDREGVAQDLEGAMGAFCDVLTKMREAGGSLYLVGNGGSAGVVSHATTDFVNVGKLKAYTLHDSSLLTCMSNDYGYENAYARLLAQMATPGDVLIAISSSGKSVNIRNAAEETARQGGRVVTFSGFAPDTPLRSMGDLNFWVDSNDYGFVEIAHQFLLHNASDRLKAS